MSNAARSPREPAHASRTARRALGDYPLTGKVFADPALRARDRRIAPVAAVGPMRRPDERRRRPLHARVLRTGNAELDALTTHVVGRAGIPAAISRFAFSANALFDGERSA